MKKSAKDEPRVQSCGPMTEENRVEAFARFDALAVPSIWFETGPFTVLEVFAAGIPGQGSNHGGIAERVEDGRSGLLIPPGDVESWREVLRQLHEKHCSGAWTWNLPALRTSWDIAEEMDEIYMYSCGYSR